jgi:radical SAM superfamily enzyme YgiQ (UPF0313 family)
MLNSKYIHSSLAQWYLLAGLEAFGGGGVTAEVVEGTVNEDIVAVAERIIEKKPAAVGFCCYIWNIAFIKRLLPFIKSALPDANIILGGPEVSYNAGDILRDEPLVDYILSGEGERPFARLLDALRAGADVSSIPGVCYRDAEHIIVSPPFCASEDPPNPYTEAYFKTLNGRIAYLETSRGCPFSCAFCLSGRKQTALPAGGGVRFFDLERAKRDVLLLAGSGTKTVKLVDRTFNANKERALALFRFIIESYGKTIPKGVCFHFEIAGDLLDEVTLELLKPAPKGAIQFEIGLQSFNPKTLEAISRKTSIDRLKGNIDKLRALGNIHIHIDLIAGLPYEDFESFAGSFNTAYTLGPHMLQLGFLKLLHGSPMRENPDIYPCRFSPAPPYEVLETPWLSPDELQRLRDAENALDSLYNSGRFRRTLAFVLEQTGLTPFELFLCTGAFLAEGTARRLPLDGFTALMLEFFGSLNGIDQMSLRDVMVCDRLASVAGGKLPEALKIPDSRLKAIMTAVNSAPETRPSKGVRRGLALLYSENAAVCCDYSEKDPVTEEYPLTRIPIPLSLLESPNNSTPKEGWHSRRLL